MPFLEFVLTSSAIASVTVAATALLSRRRRLAVITAFAGATGLVFFHGLGYLNSVPDDAYISFHYAQHLADGLGPNWNSTGRVEGYTNFLLVALLAAIGKLGFSIVVSARVLGGLSTIATLFVVYQIWTLWQEDEQDSGLSHPVFLAAVFVLLGLSSGVAYYAFSGLETPLFMLLLTTSAYLYFIERRSPSAPWSAVTLAAAAMTRPEGLIAAAVTGMFYVTVFLSATQRPRPYGRILAWTGVFALLYGSYFAWRFTYYDYLLPNTFYAKVEPGSVIFDRGLDYLRGASSQYLLLPMFAGAAFLLARSRLRHDVAYVIVISGALLLAVIYEGGDFMPYFRFAVPTLPLLYLSGMAGFATLLHRAGTHRAQAVFITAFVLSITGLSLMHDSSRLAIDRLIQRNNPPLATWFREHTPRDFRIGAVAVGVLAYYADRDIVDMAGINDTVIAHTNVPRFGAGQPGHEKYNLDYVLDEARPEIIIGLGPGPPKRREDLRPTFVPSLSLLIADPRLWENYQISWLLLDGRWFSVLTRDDIVPQLHGPGLVAPQNLLANSGNTSSENWLAQGSTLESSGDGLFVSSSQPSYGVSQFTAASDTRLAAGQRYLAVAWIRGTTRSAGGLVSISLREDGAPDAETKASFRLSNEWRPVWVLRTIQRASSSRLSVHITRNGSVPEGNVFVIQDAQVRLVEN